MEKKTIKIETIEEAKKRDGTPIAGVSQNGNAWKLYRINKKYSLFSYGEIPFKIGEEKEFDLTVKQDGEYTNYTIQISKPKMITFSESCFNALDDKLNRILKKVDNLDKDKIEPPKEIEGEIPFTEEIPPEFGG